MNRTLQVMILDDELIVGKRLKPVILQLGAEVEVFQDPSRALARLEEKDFDVVVTDIRMEPIGGLEILDRLKARSPQTRVIMITAYATDELAREALGRGAFDFVAKPFKRTALGDIVRRAAESLGFQFISPP